MMDYIISQTKHSNKVSSSILWYKDIKYVINIDRYFFNLDRYFFNLDDMI
jgi:hypothetical protein